MLSIFHYLQMFELLEAIVDDAPLQRPRSLASIKGALMDMEAVGLAAYNLGLLCDTQSHLDRISRNVQAIPEQAMPFWGDERREQWVYMVKYAASVEELLVAILYLEACIDRSWMKWRSRPIAKRRKMHTTAAQVPRILDGEDEMEASEAGVDALEQAVAGPGDGDDEIMEVCSVEEEGGACWLRHLYSGATGAPTQHRLALLTLQSLLARGCRRRPPRLRINDDWTQSI